MHVFPPLWTSETYHGEDDQGREETHHHIAKQLHKLVPGKTSHVTSGQASKEGQSPQLSDGEDQHSKKRESSLWHSLAHIIPSNINT